MAPAITPAIGNGRGLTNYLSRCELENNLQSKFRIPSDSEYRKRLQADPVPFDLAVKGYTSFQQYWPVSPCADARSLSMK